MRCEGNHAPLKGVAANPWLWLLRGDDNGLKMNRFHEELGANPRRSWLNSRNGKISMFAPAESFSANVCDGLFTHYKREEDATMKSGKLDEELSRMSQIVDQITPGSMVLFNESFAATNEREGSEIAKQIVSALLEEHIKMFFVTHLYEF